MKYSILGSSGVRVSRVCLGSMTWGKQNDQQDANAQIEYALDRGVNFIDTAEMYAIPPKPDTYGTTEAIIGNWFNANPSRRKDVILATKIAGSGLPWVRNGGPITGKAIIEAVDASLKRLQTDYIDVYQLHWPNRNTPHFNKHWPNDIDPNQLSRSDQSEQILDMLHGLDSVIKSGKVRFAGLSDDTPWGISEFLKLAEQYSLPRITSIQNEFSLVHGKDWPYLIEQCALEDIAYLPWSPLAGGLLSGKYLNGEKPAGSRWTLDQRNGIFRDTTYAHAAVAAYQELAAAYGMSTAQLSLLWCDNVNGVTSTIIGATNLSQLEEDIDAFDLTFSESLANDIEQVYKQYTQPF